MTEGSTATGVGSAIVAAFEDVDSDDELGAVFITDIDDETLGTLKYTTSNGGLVSISDSEADTGDGYELTVEEAESLVFVSESGVLDDDQSDKVNIKFTVEDSNGGLSTDSSAGTAGTVTIEIHDGNDAPYFGDDDDDGAYSSVIEVLENEDTFGELNPASDDLSDGLLTYSITGTDAEYFTVNAANGRLTFTDAPDFEEPKDYNGDNFYTFVLHAEDEGQLSASTTVTVEVQNVGQSLGLVATSATVDEGQSIAMTAEIDFSDGDSSNEVIMSLGSGSDSDLFEIDDNGVISFIDVPDFETATSTYTVNVLLTDQDELDEDDDPIDPITVPVTITLEDIHDADPIFWAAYENEEAMSASFSLSIGDVSVEINENVEVSEDTSWLLFVVDNGEWSDEKLADHDLTVELKSSAGTSNFEVNTAAATTDIGGTEPGSAVSTAIAVELALSSDISFDHENSDYDDGTFELTLKVTDNSDGTTAETVIEVQVLDENETPYYDVVPEGSAIDINDTEKFGDDLVDNIIDPEGQDLLFEIESITVEANLDDTVASSYYYTITYNGADNVTDSNDFVPPSDAFSLLFQRGGSLVEYTGQYLSEAQADSLTLVAKFTDIEEDLLSNPSISIAYRVDDDFGDNGNEFDAADAYQGTYYTSIDAGF